MPFTISHVAVVLPFARSLSRWRLLSATVIGSMVPDFGLLLPWHPARPETHSAISLLTFCLPVGLVTFWVFQRLLKVPVMAVLPTPAYARWRAYAIPADPGDPWQWAAAACGVVAGAITHLVWDGFTHEGARGVRMIPMLDDTVDIAGHKVVTAYMLQDLSSLVGLVIVFILVGYSLRPGLSVDTVPARALPTGERYLWIVGYALMAVLLAVLFLVMRHPIHMNRHSLAAGATNIAVAALRGVAAALILVSASLWVRLRADT